MKKNIKNNLDPSKNPYTTIFGVLLIVYSIILYSISLLIDTKILIEWYHYSSLFAIGMVLWFIPDDFISALKSLLSIITNFAKRKSETL